MDVRRRGGVRGRAGWGRAAMSALDDWRRLLYPQRRKILDALASIEVRNAVAELLDPPTSVNVMAGSDLTHAEEAALKTAIAVLEEA